MSLNCAPLLLACYTIRISCDKTHIIVDDKLDTLSSLTINLLWVIVICDCGISLPCSFGHVRQDHKEYNVQNYSKYDRKAHNIVFINERHIQIGLSFFFQRCMVYVKSWPYLLVTYLARSPIHSVQILRAYIYILRAFIYECV